jgi:hypothetical protein
MKTAAKQEFSLGDEVKCKVTGFKGIVTSKTVFLNGCKQCGVQSPIGKDGKWGDNYGIDESQLEMIKPAKVVVEQKPVGGPSRRL